MGRTNFIILTLQGNEADSRGVQLDFIVLY